MATLITDVKVILTAPEGINLIVVKVETNQDGLYGLGCATFAYRHLTVKCLIEEYLRPLLIGRDAEAIDELWQLMHQKRILAQRADRKQRDLRNRQGAVGHQGEAGEHAAVSAFRRQGA